MSVMVCDLNILLYLVSIQYANFVSMHHVLVLYIIIQNQELDGYFNMFWLNIATPYKFSVM